jgi:DNA ligase-1
MHPQGWSPSAWTRCCSLSYDYVGDLAETVSLVWPQTPGRQPRADAWEVVPNCRRQALRRCKRADRGLLDSAGIPRPLCLLKLMTGGLRIGVSARLAKQALADFGKVDVTEIEELWHGLHPPYTTLFAWLEGKAEKPRNTADASAR